MRITLNNKNVIFVRKDKTLFENKHKVLKKRDGYTYTAETQGVAILPYKIDKNGKMEVLVREEKTPIHNTFLTVIAGNRDDHEEGHNWWQETAQRELGEESGYWVDDKFRFSDLGKIISKKSYIDKDRFVTVNLTGIKQGEEKADSKIEKNAKNFWVEVDLLKRMLAERNNDVDSYFLALVGKFLAFMGLMDKSIEEDLWKAVEEKKAGSKRGPSPQKGKQKPVHKYIRREGQPGEYRYIYTEPEGKDGKKEEPQGIMAKLVEALGKKQGGETKEKAPPKLKPLEEFARIKEPVPDFVKGVTAEQWLGTLDSNILNTTVGILRSYKAETNLGTVMNLLERSYIFTIKDNPDAYPASYSNINVEDKKLSDRAKILVQKAIHKASQAYSLVEFYNTVMNSSMAEKILPEIEERFSKIDAEENTLRDAYKDVLKRVASPVLGILNILNIVNDLIAEVNLLSKNDPKLNFMIDKIYESTDSLMKARDRYIEDSVVFFINQIEPKLADMSDWYSFKSVMGLIDGFQDFNENVINNSTISAVNPSFANQWNLKQKGVYDGASKYLSNSVGRMIDTYRDVEAIQGSGVLDDIGIDFIEKPVFNFLSLVHDQKRRFAVNEQAFSYIDHFGLDRYHKDIVYLSAIYDRVHDTVPSKVRVQGSLERVENAYQATPESHKDMVEASSYVKVNKFRTSTDGIINTITLLNPKTNEFAKIDSFIAAWSNASHGSLMTNAIEEMVNSKGIDRESYVNYHLASNRTINARRPETKQALANAINVIYDDTQSVINKEYDDKITLFRGNGSHESKSVASSWTWKSEEAVKFGDHVTEASVPHEAVLLFSSPTHHSDAWEYKDEGEFVLVPGLLPASQKIKTRPVDATDMIKIREAQNKKIDEMADAMDYADTHGSFAAMEKFGDTY